MSGMPFVRRPYCSGPLNEQHGYDRGACERDHVVYHTAIQRDIRREVARGQAVAGLIALEPTAEIARTSFVPLMPSRLLDSLRHPAGHGIKKRATVDGLW